MKTIESSYKEYTIPKKVQEEMQDPFALVLGIEGIVKELEQEEKIVMRKRKRNHFVQLLLGDNEFLKREDSYWEQLFQILEDNLDLLVAVTDLITTENYLEIVKFVDFLITHFTNNRSYIEGRLEGLNQSIKGIQYIDNRHPYTHKDFLEWAKKYIEQMKSTKQLEKKQEI